MTLDATPKSATANSYCTIAEADDWLLTGRLYTTAWATAQAADKNKVLIWATFLLDNVFEWKGLPRTTTQALRWPRSGVRNRDLYWFDYDLIPDVLKRCTAELAMLLLSTDRTKELAQLGLGMSEISISRGLFFKMDKTFVVEIVPNTIVMQLSVLGDPMGALNGDRTVKLLRT